MSPEQIHNDMGTLSRIIEEEYHNDPGSLIMILQNINTRYHHLPQEALSLTSRQVGIPLSQIYSIATFYKAFSLEPKGEHTVKICVGTACHVRGGQRVKERLEASMGIQEGGTTADMRFSLETVRCVGCCSLGPVVMVDDETYSRTNSETILKALEKYNQPFTQQQRVTR